MQPQLSARRQPQLAANDEVTVDLGFARDPQATSALEPAAANRAASQPERSLGTQLDGGFDGEAPTQRHR